MQRHLAWPILLLLPLTAPAGEKFVRFQAFPDIAGYGLVEGDNVRLIAGDLFGEWKKTDQTYRLSKVRLLPPTRPSQVLALAGNYKSHLPGEEIAPKFQIVQPFHKPPACLVGHDDAIVIPEGTAEVHYEAELVVVIGKRAKDVPREKAKEYVFGVTCGNDVSARDWQKNDVQWWRAKGCDTFGPCGPYIATGLDYDNLMLTLRQNGEVKQKQSTRDLIHSVADTVSFISKHTTLEPGDLIFTGTPGKTAAIKPGDVIEVELEGVGVLRNPVRAKEKK
jgi:2-keto-4-pentenoate hydratase/2-oxohepta-3-ene-1,7-dioic acid hydratase in catechol pathway